MTNYVRTVRVAAALALGVTAAAFVPAASPAGATTAPVFAEPGGPCSVSVTLTFGGRSRAPLTIDGTVSDNGEQCGSLPEGLTNALANVLGGLMGGKEKAQQFFGRGLVSCEADRTFGSTENNVRFAATCGDEYTS